MILTFADGWTNPAGPPDWPLPGSPHFATSRAYEIFLRELRRYTLEEINGRSFLIAGHRGAGKTALVTQAIRQLRVDLLQASIDPDTRTVSRRGRLQRPLVVKLVAQSLLAPPPPREGAKEEPPKKKPAPAKPEEEEAADDADAPPAKPRPKAPPDEIASALVHITIALYRALAQEVAQGFVNHARSAAAPARDDRLELAAQLLLDLDDAPEPALLRRKWAQLDRLAAGILWPAGADATLSRNAIADQGLREVVAIATAAQAFQVVSGDVTFSVRAVDSSTRDDETKSRVDIKDLIGRLGAIFAGTAVGATTIATSNGAPLAVGLGLLTWLGSSAALGYSSTGKRHRERKRDYTFLRDRSIQTLDRELPLVIERIRDAGLAPIFVLDELDKLGDARATISALIDRLKHIVSDFGFFCFLANRDYYDAIERQVRIEAYPSEHTYFSERLFVFNRPYDLFNYVTGLIVTDESERDVDSLPIATFALLAIYRSKLNFTDLSRELNRHAKPDGALTFSTRELRERRDLRLAAAIQLAGDQALRAEPIATLFASDEAFAQLASDALYYLPRQWEDDPTGPVDLSEETLKLYLLGRIDGKGGDEAPAPKPKPKPEPEPAPPPARRGRAQGAAPKPTAPEPPEGKPPENKACSQIPPPHLALIVALVRRQVGYLASWKTLADALRDRPRPDPWRLDEIVPLEIGAGLLEPIQGKPDQYRFLLGQSGLALAAAPAPEAEADAVDPALESLAFLKAFLALVAAASLTTDDLVRAGYLPATITSGSLAEAERLLGGTDRASDLIRDGERTVGLLRQALSERRRLMSLALYALVDYGRYAPGRRPADLLMILARYFSPAGKETSADTLSPFERIVDLVTQKIELLDITTPIGLTNFTTALQARREKLGKLAAEPPDPVGIARLWEKWRARLQAWFDEGRNLVEDFEHDDVVTAVAGKLPGTLFSADLASVSIGDWSALVLAALPGAQPPQEEKAPLWACFAGLRALGFDQRTLLALLASIEGMFATPIDDATRATIMPIVERAPGNRPAGLLLFARQGTTPILSGHEWADRPILAVAANDYSRYEAGIDWLVDAGAFEGVIDERD